MRSVNKVILVGNITKDPNVKQTGGGHNFVTFSLATNREWYTPEGEKQSLAEFHRIAAWGKLADICGEFLKKGKLIYVEGYLKTRTWDQDGIKHFRTEVIAQDMIMLDKKGTHEENFIPEQEIPSVDGDVDLDGDQI